MKNPNNIYEFECIFAGKSLWMRCLFCICGFDPRQVKLRNPEAPKPNFNVHEEQLKNVDAIEEHPLSKRICTVGAVILIAIGAFIHGFYA